MPSDLPQRAGSEAVAGASIPVAGERILVCVGPAPSSARLIETAARMAGRLGCPWVAAYVESPRLAVMADSDRERLEAHLRQAETLGATVTRLFGDRVAETLLAFARRHEISRIIIGKPTHSRLRDRLWGSLLDEVVRGTGEIEVHAIGVHDARESIVRSPGARLTARAILRHAGALALVALAVAVASALRALLGLPDPEMLFLLVVMLAAVWFGRGPSLLTAALGVASYDFFFVAPAHTFDVADPRYWPTFAMMLGVGFAVSELAGRLKRQEKDAVTREARTAALYALGRDLASAAGAREIADIAARRAAEAFSASAVLFYHDSAALRPYGAMPAGAVAPTQDAGAIQRCFERGQLTGLGTVESPASAGVYAPLALASSVLGVLALIPKQRAPFSADQRAFVEVFCRQVAIALERVRLAEDARASALRAKAEEMRSSLLSAVSHDLRTPLASITGAATALRDNTNLPDVTRAELVVSICEEAERLERLVANLLDMVRLESGALSLRRDWVPLDEIVGSALTRLEERLDGREVVLALPGDLPLLFVDPVLFEQLFVNLLENAAKYTGPASPLELRARREEDSVTIELSDRGPGLPAGAERQIFDKFYRGPHAGAAGAGLGLSICRGIAEAHGGVIRARNRTGGGAVFSVSVPVRGEPPPLPSVEDAGAEAW